MRILDLVLLIVIWASFVVVLTLVKHARRDLPIEIYYGLAVLVRGRESVERFVRKAAQLIQRVPDNILVSIVVGLFAVTMLFLVPVPLVLTPGVPGTLLALDHMLFAAPVLLLRNLFLVVNYIAQRITPAQMLQQGFLTLQPLIPGITASLEIFLVVLGVIGVSILVHELAHGALAARYGLPIKSGGFFTSFFILSGGFVEVDEEKLQNMPLRRRLAVYSAGVVANLCLALLAVAIYILLCALTDTIGVPLGVLVEKSSIPGLSPGDVIVAVRGTHVHNVYEFIAVITHCLMQREPVLDLLVMSSGSLKRVTLTLDSLNMADVFDFSKFSLTTVALRSPELVVTNTPVYDVLFWLVILNVTLALLNTMPAYPLDGGLVLLTVLEQVVEKNTARAITYAVSALMWLCVALSIIYTFEAGLYLPVW